MFAEARVQELCDPELDAGEVSLNPAKTDEKQRGSEPRMWSLVATIVQVEYSIEASTSAAVFVFSTLVFAWFLIIFEISQ